MPAGDIRSESVETTYELCIPARHETYSDSRMFTLKELCDQQTADNYAPEHIRKNWPGLIKASPLVWLGFETGRKYICKSVLRHGGACPLLFQEFGKRAWIVCVCGLQDSGNKL